MCYDETPKKTRFVKHEKYQKDIPETKSQGRFISTTVKHQKNWVRETRKIDTHICRTAAILFSSFRHFR